MTSADVPIVGLVLRIDEMDADDLRLEELALSLRRELLDADAGEVTQAANGSAPDGTRGLDAVTVGTLLVSVSGSALAMAQVVGIVKGWLRRGTPDSKVELSFGGKTITVTGGDESDARRIVAELASALSTPTPSAADPA